MSGLSLMLDAFRKAQGANRQPGKYGARTSARAPAVRGFARGTTGVMGSKMLQTRDSSAGESKDRAMLSSPIFRAFIQKSMGRTPITDMLHGA